MELSRTERRDEGSAFVWSYAQRAEQPACFRRSCGACGPPYATRVPFAPHESARLERCYLHALESGSRGCPHLRVDFANMRQTLKDGSVRDVYRERTSVLVEVGGEDEPVRREATRCPHAGPPPAM